MKIDDVSFPIEVVLERNVRYSSEEAAQYLESAI